MWCVFVCGLPVCVHACMHACVWVGEGGREDRKRDRSICLGPDNPSCYTKLRLRQLHLDFFFLIFICCCFLIKKNYIKRSNHILKLHLIQVLIWPSIWLGKKKKFKSCKTSLYQTHKIICMYLPMWLMHFQTLEQRNLNFSLHTQLYQGSNLGNAETPVWKCGVLHI